jgi:hypothetical protein
MTLARLLPIAERFDVYLLGTGLPSFWVAKMADMRLTLGLSGWTTNDWTKGSAVQMLLPPQSPNDALVAKVADNLHNRRALNLADLSSRARVDKGQTAGALNQLALRGQAIYDLDSDLFRWRQVLPMAVSEKEMGPPHAETEAARALITKNKVKINSSDEGPRGGWIVTAKAEGKPCEALINADGMVVKGKCLCSWHFKFGIRNGPCRHIQAVRDLLFNNAANQSGDWYEKRLLWAGRS